MLHLCILMLTIGLVYSTCPTGKFPYNGICVPPSTSICPSNSIYSSGACRYRTDFLCNDGNVYNSGVCARYSPSAACTQTPLHCVQPTGCHSNSFNECPYGQVCPQNLIMYGGRCVTQSIAQCPKGTQLQSGHCVRPSLCPQGSAYQQGSCAPTLPVSPLQNCPTNSHRVDGMCIQDNNVACPISSNFINGECVRDEPCLPGTFEYNGVCAQCPINSTYINGNCVHCLPGMILKNGRCVCKPGQTLLGDDCVYFKNVTCADDEIFTEGKCIPPYCYGSRCCTDAACNSCFLKCEKKHHDTSSLSNCQSNCVDSKQINFKLPELTVKLNNTKVNVDNLVNSTNAHNIDTKTNNTNANHVNLEGMSHSGSVKKITGNKTSSYEIEKKEESCCFIISPRRCVNFYGKYKCYQSKKHACGDECQAKTTVATPISIYPTQPIPRFMYQYPQPIPRYFQRPIIYQQPQIINQQPTIVTEQPQVIEKIQVTQQPQVIQQPYYVYYQQPQSYSQIQYQVVPQQMYTYQQPQVISQPYMMLPQLQSVRQQNFQHQFVVPTQIPSVQLDAQKNSVQYGCVYQNVWPYVKCVS